MRLVRLLALAIFVAALALSTAQRFTVEGQGATEALTGFDGLTNGFTSQEQFDFDRAVFEQRKIASDGLGPVYNAQSCAECHQNPITGGISQITNLRADHFNRTTPVDLVDDSLIQDRAIHASLQERVVGGDEKRTFRTSLNLLGDGFVECIDSNTLLAISNDQPASMRGQFIQVPVFEANGALRGGRFGWKNQHASLVSASAQEYLDQIGITNELQPTEHTSNGRDISAFDAVPDPEDSSGDVDAFARFVRSTKVPPRDTVVAATIDAQVGSDLFNSIGCSVCHFRSITTAPSGTVINGGHFTVPPALGNKIIHPFSDFLLHDVDTGDGIVQNGAQSTRNKVRTPPLWGVRTRDRLMHDGKSLTLNEAILRHAGQATGVINIYSFGLSETQRNQLLTFLRSL